MLKRITRSARRKTSPMPFGKRSYDVWLSAARSTSHSLLRPYCEEPVCTLLLMCACAPRAKLGCASIRCLVLQSGSWRQSSSRRTLPIQDVGYYGLLA